MGTLAEQRCKVFGCCHRRPHVWDLNGGVVGFVAGLTHCKENLSDDGMPATRVAFTHPSRAVTIINRLTLSFTALPWPLLRRMFFSYHYRGCRDALLAVDLSCNNKITVHSDVKPEEVVRVTHLMHTMSTAISVHQLGTCLSNANDKTGTDLLRNVSPDSRLSGLLGPQDLLHVQGYI
jgi:hypothetical protein